jgi:hypothetical protein
VSLQRAKIKTLQSVGPWWIAGWFCQSVWQVLFCANTPLSLALSALLLVGATKAFHEALVNTETILATNDSFSGIGRLLVSAASAINAAWLSVATILGICIAVSVNTEKSILTLATILASGVALNGVYIGLTRHTFLYVLTLIWAFAGVYMEQAAQFVEIKYATTCALVALGVAALWALWRSGSSQRKAMAPQQA